MTLEELKEKLVGNCNENVLLFENPDYADAFIGVDTDDRAVYLYSKMVESLMESDNMSEEDAVDFISYNTIRALDYAGPNAPIVVYDDWE